MCAGVFYVALGDPKRAHQRLLLALKCVFVRLHFLPLSIVQFHVFLLHADVVCWCGLLKRTIVSTIPHFNAQA